MIPVISFSQDSINKIRINDIFLKADSEWVKLNGHRFRLEPINQKCSEEILRLNSDSSEIVFNGIRYLRVPPNRMIYSNTQLKYVTEATVEIQYRGWCTELCIVPTFDGFIVWKNKYNKY